MSTIKSSAENLTLNADGANNDIIFQSNGSTKVTLDGQNTRLGIGTATPSGALHIQTASSGGTANTAADDIVLEGTSNVGIQFLSATDGNARFLFGDSGANNIGQIKYNHDINELTFYANTALGLSIESDSDIKVAAGDLYFGTAGKGIVLGATTNVDANTLDDYEEGTFTPTLTGSGSAASYTEQAGNYTKIGNLVHVTIKLACSKGTLSGGVYLDSLPFSAGIDTWGMKFDWYQPYGTALLESGAFFNAGASKLSLYGLTAANNDATAQQFTDSWISGVAKFRLNFSYRTNS